MNILRVYILLKFQIIKYFNLNISVGIFLEWPMLLFKEVEEKAEEKQPQEKSSSKKKK